VPKSNLVHYVKLHFTVLILGFTAILGKLIQLDAFTIVWARMLNKQAIIAMGVGTVVAAHWITFYHAIKISNISITLIVLSTTTLFTSFLEPLFIRRRINWLEVVIGLVIIAGIFLIFDSEIKFSAGIWVALVSAILAGLFTVLNAKLQKKYQPSVFTFYQMLGGFLSICVFFLFSGGFNAVPKIFTELNWLYLVILGTFCTAYAFIAMVQLMKYLTAYTIVLSINMEPIYGILMALMIFGDSEEMTGGFYIGGAIILASVVLYSGLNHFIRKKDPSELSPS